MGKKYGPKPVPFKPVNPEKYTGTYPIISRSRWETAAMKYFDRCNKCISWGSESAVVRYLDPVKQKIRRYFIDFTAVFETKDGTQKKFYIEVKPHRQTIPPKASKRKKPKTLLNESNTWKTNQAKWDAAHKWAKTKGATFLILTEKDLFFDK
jgi:tRNA(Ile2) C34 agmatinyltransferase TiaS